ncbi:D-serine ammonia-lyase [Pontibacterium granulatum]|uniref:D-serine ammonia-lyase n=1 Tax=Pontibacterium granulatum TaxID=2036029 RepID=UPI00249C70DD|nr:D-serine ammonia-lyase [Pontibacterium granulatum]MDI3323469.1 D-serine ammonia-lyase [Pontibacterium granulatum]
MTNLNLTQQEKEKLSSGHPLFWLNPAYQNAHAAPDTPDVAGIYEAEARLARFAPLLIDLFPELKDTGGLIESPLLPTDALNKEINPIGGRLFLKADHALPVAGSIKARGGIHEVLCFAEQLALKEGLIAGPDDDYRKLGSDESRTLFAQHTIAVGSTGNLGLSIGIMGAALGFNAVVHMSSDAKEWKKERLRKRGVKVVEHTADYGAAVAAGRAESDADPHSYFVDDENSPRLFMGYAVAALRLKTQLDAAGIEVSPEQPLIVYLPAGVGGAPGGITFGLKALFGDNVHCFFAEPVQAPCMLLGMAGEAGQEPVPIYELGLQIDTDADGLAVGTASQWVCDAVRHQVSGVYTATDDELYQHLFSLKNLENVEVEPSAAISCCGPAMLNTGPGRQYLEAQNIANSLKNGVHVAWLTGGSFVPDKEYQRYLEKAIKISN